MHFHALCRLHWRHLWWSIDSSGMVILHSGKNFLILRKGSRFCSYLTSRITPVLLVSISISLFAEWHHALFSSTFCMLNFLSNIDLYIQLGTILHGFEHMVCFWRKDCNASGSWSMILKLSVCPSKVKGVKRFEHLHSHNKNQLSELWLNWKSYTIFAKYYLLIIMLVLL